MGTAAEYHLVHVICCSKWFSISGGSATPKDYMTFDKPLAAGAVRLGVFRLTDADSDGLATAAHQATQTILSQLPTGLPYCTSLATSCHVRYSISSKLEISIWPLFSGLAALQ